MNQAYLCVVIFFPLRNLVEVDVCFVGAPLFMLEKAVLKDVKEPPRELPPPSISSIRLKGSKNGLNE